MRLYFPMLQSVALVLLIAGSTSADLNVDRNGVVWPFTFEGNALPDDNAANPAWAIFDLQGPTFMDMSDGDIYTITTFQNPSNMLSDTVSWAQNTSPRWATGSAARTVEFRVRIPNDPSIPIALDGAAAVTIGMNNRGYDLRLYDTKIAFNGANINGGVTDPVNIVNIDLTEFHTFRIVIDQNAASVYKLFIDNNPVPAFESNDWWFDAGGFDTLNFGDISTGGLYGKSEWDFISWDPNLAIPLGLAADFDGDSDTDGADFLIWQRGYGLSGQTDNSNGDADGNGSVGPEDLAIWQSEYGAGSNLSPAIRAVPEPGTLLISIVSFTALGFWRRGAIGINVR